MEAFAASEDAVFPSKNEGRRVEATVALGLIRLLISSSFLGGKNNYGHDDFIIGLLRDTTPNVECYDVIMEQSILFCGITRASSTCYGHKKGCFAP